MMRWMDTSSEFSLQMGRLNSANRAASALVPVGCSAVSPAMRLLASISRVANAWGGGFVGRDADVLAHKLLLYSFCSDHVRASSMLRTAITFSKGLCTFSDLLQGHFKLSQFF